MNSAPSNYSECKFSAKSDNFKKITMLGKIFDIFEVENAPPGVDLEFSWHIHCDFLKEDHMGSSITKIRKIYSGVWKI